MGQMVKWRTWAATLHITRKRIGILAPAGIVAVYLAAAGVLAAAGETPHGRSTEAARPVQEQQAAGTGKVSVSHWTEADLRNGLSAQRLMRTQARGSNGDAIGEVRDVLFTRDGSVQALVVSAGGVVGVGETLYRVPWKQVHFEKSLKHVTVPISPHEIDRFRWGAEQVRAGVNELRASEMMQSALILQDATRYGQVDDVIIGRDGQVKALVVSSVLTAYGQKRYAFPYSAQIAHKAARKELVLPYTSGQLADLRPFDYTALGIAGVGVGSDTQR